ncbi:MAG TPA: hypothetical protein VG826_11665 [Pirellulales bacterium]|nr:hypothetical protein [Pirellulales bacterium]
MPQFSLRSILAVTAVCGIVSLVGAAALRGAPWAGAVITSIAALAAILAVHGLMFFVVWLLSLVTPGGRAAAVGQSPFAPASTKES